MHQRKQMMAERADAFIAMPGGIGTLEELYEVWTWRQLGYHDKPVGLLNVDGYYDALLAFMRTAVEHGFLSAPQHGAAAGRRRPDATAAGRCCGGRPQPRRPARDDYSAV